MHTVLFAMLLAADFQIAGHGVRPGTRVNFELAIPAASDPATFIPVSVFHGKSPGPALLVSAGVHGAEYAPILAVQRLQKLIDPEKLRGTLIVLPVVHVASFQTATAFYNPFDRKNLARVFPGKPDGTQTERIAHALTTEVLPHADALIDLHGGDATESLHPFVGVYGGKMAEKQYETVRRIGLALGFQTMVKYTIDTPQQVNGIGRSFNRQAVADGKPSVLIEIGDRGRRDEASVELIVEGLLNALRTLEMTGEKPHPVRQDVQWITRVISVPASATGIFYPLTEAGKTIRKGEKAGYIANY